METYIDHGISGAKQKRLAFSRMCKDAMRRKFDVLWCERSIVIGRSVHDDVSGFMVEMETLGLKLYYDKRAIETATFLQGKGDDPYVHRGLGVRARCDPQARQPRFRSRTAPSISLLGCSVLNQTDMSLAWLE